MSIFTIKLKDVLKADRPEQADFSLIGLDQYTCWDENYKYFLNLKIVYRFWEREIGFETVEQFVFHMRRKMNEIMPYHNKLFESTLLEFDPLKTVDVLQVVESDHESDQKTFDVAKTVDVNKGKNVTGNTIESLSRENVAAENTGVSDANSRVVSAETPQTRLNDYEDYATGSTDSRTLTSNTGESLSDSESTVSQDGETTSVSDDKNTSKNSSRGGTQNKDKTKNVSRETGFNTAPAELVQLYRETLIDVDLMILDELEKLFIGIWDNGENYIPNPWYNF